MSFRSVGDAGDRLLGTLSGAGRVDESAPAEGAPVGRCDRCPAEGAVRIRLSSGGGLVLCGHHGRRYAAVLRGQGAVVTGDLAFSERGRVPSPV
jgi:hypothetical protein